MGSSGLVNSPLSPDVGQPTVNWKVSMEGGTKTNRLDDFDIEIKEHRLGAFTGEFPTILVALLSGIAGGMLGAIGSDIWKALKEYLQKRYRELESDRKSKENTREGRSRVLTVYIVTEIDGVPLVYYVVPADETLPLDLDFDALSKAEDDVSMLLKAKKLNRNEFLGINLGTLGRGPYLRRFDALPLEDAILREITADREKVEAYTHSLVGTYFDELDMLDAARRHYELAIQGVPDDAKLRVNLGITYAREGDLPMAKTWWEEAARIDGKLDVLHYNLACFHASRGDAEAAARELKASIDHGFRDVGVLLHDPEFAPVLKDEKIQALVREIKALLKN